MDSKTGTVVIKRKWPIEEDELEGSELESTEEYLSGEEQEEWEESVLGSLARIESQLKCMLDKISSPKQVM